MVVASRLVGMLWTRLLRFSWGRVIVLLAVAWAVLQVLHMTLLGRLEARKAQLQRSRLTKQLHDDSLQLYNAMRARVDAAQIVDSSGEYKIIKHVYQGQKARNADKDASNNNVNSAGGRKHSANSNELPLDGSNSNTNDVTLVTQCSVNRLDNLIQLSQRWQGPISVAVFAPDQHAIIAMEIIVKLFQCVPAFREHVSVHLVFPFVQAPDLSQAPREGDGAGGAGNVLPSDFSSCFDLEKELLTKASKRLNEKNYALPGNVKYPNNLLRNVALDNARTKYIFVIDVDMLPSSSLHRDFSSFIDRQRQVQSSDNHEKTAFVVPAFEISSEITPPGDKADLIGHWGQHKVRPFYSETCWKCHRWTDYEAWRNLTVSGLEVGYEVEWRDPWEPFYIAARDAMPKYDERFKQYGFNRISQVCELHIAGYTFSVLNNAFLVHRGFKTADGFHLDKDAEQDRNRLLFRQYKEELKTKYPDSERRCY